MNRTLWVVMFFAGVMLFGYSQGLAVMPYPLSGSAGMEQSIEQPVKGLEERFRKHETENIQDLNEIKKQLTRIEQQGVAITNQVSSWKMISLILFVFNLILFVIVWRAVSSRKS